MPQINKILIIRFSSIGDIVLTTPLIRCLRKQFPEAQIDYLCKKEYLPVLQGNPYISQCISIHNKVSEVISQLKNEHYDFVVDLHKNYRSALLTSQLRRPSGTFNKLNIKKWLLVNFRIHQLPEEHIVDRYFRAVQKLDVLNDMNGLDYFIPDADEIDKMDLPPAHRNGYIGFAIGGMHKTKMLPIEKVISVCKHINKALILLGGKEDHASGVKIQMAVGDKIFNACGLYNINQSASLIRQAEKVISNDTGLMHIAAAFNKHIVSIWGSTVPEFGMYPYMPQSPGRSNIIEVKNLSCRPCSKIGFAKCPKKHFKCMMEIPEEEIVDKMKI